MKLKFCCDVRKYLEMSHGRKVIGESKPLQLIVRGKVMQPTNRLQLERAISNRNCYLTRRVYRASAMKQMTKHQIEGTWDSWVLNICKIEQVCNFFVSYLWRFAIANLFEVIVFIHKKRCQITHDRKSAVCTNNPPTFLGCLNFMLSWRRRTEEDSMWQHLLL